LFTNDTHEFILFFLILEKSVLIRGKKMCIYFSHEFARILNTKKQTRIYFIFKKFGMVAPHAGGVD